MSMLPSCAWPKANYPCWWRLPAPASTPLPNCPPRPRRPGRRPSGSASSRQCRTLLLKCGPTTASNLPLLSHCWSQLPHLFATVCAAHGIEHRCTQVAHPWTNGQVEWLNRTRKEATIQRYHYRDARELNAHLQPFLRADNGGKRLKKLHGDPLRGCVRSIHLKSGYLYTKPNPRLSRNYPPS